MGSIAHIIASLAFFALAGYALHASITDQPEGDEETAACIEAADAARVLNPETSCDDAGSAGYGFLAAAFTLAAAVFAATAGGKD